MAGGLRLLILLGILASVPVASAQPPSGVVAPPEDWPAVQRELGQLREQLQAQQLELERQQLLIEQLTAEPAIPPEYEPATACSSATDDGPMFRLGGQYRLIFDSANFDFHPEVITDDQDSLTLFNQRFRTWLSVNPNECVQGYIQVEMGHILWGSNYDFPKTYPGPFSEQGDRVGVELRRGYLTYWSPAGGRWRAGIQDWHDAFGESYTLGTEDAIDDYDSFGAVLANSIWDFNVGGLSYTRSFAELSDLNVNAGAFVLNEGDVHRADDAYLLALDLDLPASDEQSVGMSVYHVMDRDHYSYPTTAPYDNAWDFWIGVRANTSLAALPVQGFAIYNTGRRNEFAPVSDFSHDDAALKLALGPLPLGCGKINFQTLYASAGFRTIAQTALDDFGAQGYWSYFLLSSPHGPSDVDDLGVSLQNRGLGLFTVQGKYDYPITDRLSATIAAGWLQSAAGNPVSGSRDMGTEIVKTLAADLGGGLTLDLGAAVFFTGDFYRAGPAAPKPDTLWEAFTRVQLEF